MLRDILWFAIAVIIAAVALFGIVLKAVAAIMVIIAWLL